MEEAIEDLIDEPAGDARATYGGHLFGWISRGVFINGRSEPRRYGAPFSPDIEGKVVDRAVKAREAVDVLVVVKGGSGLSKALVGERVLKLLHLGFFIKVILLYFPIFIFCEIN